MKEQILHNIEAFDTIIIHRHIRPDPDAYGSQGALAELIKSTYPNKHVYVVGEEEESLHFLNRMDQIDNEVYNDALVIVCDTANQERISDDRFKKGKVLIKIDHHPNEDPYGDIVWVDTNASSVSEMIYEFYVFGKEKGLIMSQKAAKLIYAGIVGDTGRFLFANTKVKTFHIAAVLLETGINPQSIYDRLYESKVNEAKLSGYIMQNFNCSSAGVASIRLDKQMLQQYDMKPNETSKMVGLLGNIEGVRAWVMFVEEEDQIRVRIRSKGPVINTVAKQYNGGGHPLASGATIYDWNEADDVLAALERVCVYYEGK